MRLIDADEFERVMYHEAFETDSDLQKWDSGCWIRYKMFENAIENFPAVDAVPVKHGHWIASDPRTTDAFWVCSCCGFPSEAHGAFKLYHYCPQCGAKMDALAKDINVRCKSDEVTES